MFRRVLIANRGEIALRIIRACHELDIETVLVYSTADKESLGVKLATESICIGSEQSKDSYLNMANILSAAILSKVDAIHPGYGFLSENPNFVDLVEKCNIDFIGPKKETIELLGNKSRARKLMIDNEIPVLPGSDGDVESMDELKRIASKIGYPLIIKASSGGGGRGMRIIYDDENLEKEYLNAKSESRVSFGTDKVYVERYVEDPRHIEVQILADNFGNVIHLGERDCSIQRRNQKILEESPAPRLSLKTRNTIRNTALKIAKISNYRNAGTVEFIVDKNEKFYFLEMNTRLQVEHPVTEMVSGIDLVKEQVRIASGLKLRYRQEDVLIRGHAIECRINCEDIYNGFMPSFGRIENLNIPNGFNVRFDSHIYEGYEIGPYYDSLIGKLVVSSNNRLEAIKKMRTALEELNIEGIEVNTELHYGIMHDLDFVKGSYGTKFLDHKLRTDFKKFLIENGEMR